MSFFCRCLVFCWKQKLGHYEGHVLLLQMPSVLFETGTVQRAYSVVIRRDLVCVFKKRDGGGGVVCKDWRMLTKGMKGNTEKVLGPESFCARKQLVKW